MIDMLLGYLARRLGIVSDTFNLLVEVPDDVMAELARRPGSRLRTRFDVVEPKEEERTVYVVVTETKGVVQ